MSTAEPTVYPVHSAPPSDDAKPRVSVLLTVTERPQPLAALYREYIAPLRRNGEAVEVLVLTEPWGRPLTAELEPLIAAGEPIRVFSVAQTVGETNLLKVGAAHARGDIIVTLPSFHRVVPGTLPRLIEEVAAGVDVVVARRWPRKDSWINRLQNRAFHTMIGSLTGTRIHDVACGVRAMRRDVMQDLPIYGDFFRFLPLFALREGYRVEEIDAEQHPGDVSARVFSPGTYLRRMLDVVGLFFLLRFTDKPLRFFGLAGTAFSTVGAVLLFVLFVQRVGGQALAERPLLVLSVLLLVLGIQSIALGLIGEIIVHLNAPHRRPYRLAREPQRRGDDASAGSPWAPAEPSER
jgi:hypothetical protein